MKTIDYHFEVQVVRKGQPRAYADTVNEFIVGDQSVTPHSEEVIKAFL